MGGKQEVDKDIASGMCQTTWKIVLNALSQLLARCSSEEIILQLLKVQTASDQACPPYADRLVEKSTAQSLWCMLCPWVVKSQSACLY